MAGYAAGFADLTEEVSDRRLDVDGDLPAWLEGTLIRNGPARWSVDGAEADHWFDGLAHLTRFCIADSEVRYTNRFLRTDAYRTATEEGSFAGQFASSGSYLTRLTSMLSGESTDNANVHVARLDGEYVALTETPNWVTFDPESLESAGVVDFADDLTAHHITAHLRRDDDTGETWGYFTRFGRTNEYVVFRVPDGTLRREAVARFEVDRPAYMHSFALTEDHVVLIEPPLVTHPARFLLPGSGGFIDNYDWKPHRGTRFLVFAREGGELVARATTDAFFTFHTANAFRDGDSLVVDLVAYDDASPVTDLAIADLRAGDADFPTGDLRRYRLPLESGGVACEHVADDLEMPRFSPDQHMQAYRFVYGQSTDIDGESGGNALTRIDVETGERREWFEPGVFTGEPVFVPRPVGDGEADGVVLSLCLDTAEARSLLVVLDGEMAEVARAPLPHAVPFGFHGEFFGAEPSLTETTHQNR